MFWIIVLMAAIAGITFKLGALSVLNTILSIGLLAALLLIAGFVLVLLWRYLFRRVR